MRRINYIGKVLYENAFAGVEIGITDDGMLYHRQNFPAKLREMTKMKRWELIEEYLDTLWNDDMDELIKIHNDYCLEVNEWNNIIYKMDEFDEYCADMTPSEIADMIRVYGRDFKTIDNYFTSGDMLKSFSTIGRGDIVTKDIAIYADTHFDNLYNTGIDAILMAND